MNFLTDRIRPMYFRYLSAAFGSALISSIYGVVDMAIVASIRVRRVQQPLRLSVRSGISSTALDCWLVSAVPFCFPHPAVLHRTTSESQMNTLPHL